VKQKTHISYWFLSIIILLLFVLVACVRPVPDSEQPQVAETPAVQPTSEQMPPEVPSTPTPLPEFTEPYPEPGEPTPVSGTEPTVTDPTAVPAPSDLPTNHTVQDGETLFSISQQYGVSAEEIAAANNITTSSTLTVGQVLVIGTTPSVVVDPVPPTSGGEQTHTVQPGENLFRISLRYGKTVDEVAAYNGIANPHYIYPGQVIRIP
jgi:LysM repeat protein